MKKPFFDCAVDFFKRNRLHGTAGIVAVSAGPDSVALASALTRLLRAGGLGKLVLGHVNHQLRGADSDADEAFVQELANAWQIRCRTARIDVSATGHGNNLENAGRRLRYASLTDFAISEGASWIATGHTADDQAETVIFRLLRGTGLQGLCGIPESRRLAPGIDLLRPLLAVSRDQVLRYLEEQGVAYRLDRSNDDPRFTRNRIRHELMPRMRDYNSALAEVLGSLARQATEVQSEISKQAHVVLERIELPKAGAQVILSVARLAEASIFWRREVFRLVWARENWPMGEMNFEDWQRLAEMAERREGTHDFPGSIRARLAGSVMQIGTISKKDAAPPA